MSELAEAVYDVLVEECRAHPDDRATFVRNFDEHARLEWRFVGALGMGGKVWKQTRPMLFVTCYSEDETPERLAMIERANARLAALVSGMEQAS